MLKVIMIMKVINKDDENIHITVIAANNDNGNNNDNILIVILIITTVIMKKDEKGVYIIKKTKQKWSIV